MGVPTILLIPAPRLVLSVSCNDTSSKPPHMFRNCSLISCKEPEFLSSSAIYAFALPPGVALTILLSVWANAEPLCGVARKTIDDTHAIILLYCGSDFPIIYA